MTTLHLLRSMHSDIAALNLVVSCTARKSVNGAIVAARNATSAQFERRIEKWTEALEQCEFQLLQARDLYCGDSWATIRTAIHKPSFIVDWWIVSAGYGLIRSDELIAPYSATFVRGHEDSVVRAG